MSQPSVAAVQHRGPAGDDRRRQHIGRDNVRRGHGDLDELGAGEPGASPAPPDVVAPLRRARRRKGAPGAWSAQGVARRSSAERSSGSTTPAVHAARAARHGRAHHQYVAAGIQAPVRDPAAPQCRHRPARSRSP